VTVGDKLLAQSESMMKRGDYSEGYYLHGFGVRLAEAAAEYVNREIRKELQLSKDRGLRYSWGYPAIHGDIRRFLITCSTTRFFNCCRYASNWEWMSRRRARWCRS
jgi:hypothetical protein